MSEFDPKAHWNRIYRERDPTAVSWYQAQPTLSLTLIRRSGTARDAPIIDVGGGASTLVDALLADGFRHLAVLDISAQAIAHAQARLGPAAQGVEWYEADVTCFTPPHRFSLWHDRAVLHFLTDQAARLAYREALNRALSPGGQVIIAAFAPGGPTRCSNLDIVQYDAPSLTRLLGSEYRPLESVEETHQTPTGASQRFGYHRFRRADTRRRGG